MHSRVQVEIEWFIALSSRPRRAQAARRARPRTRLRQLVADFIEPTAAAIKAIERTTNHDVKAVEYWHQASASQDVPALARASEFIHFACTSEDINNTATR